MLYLSANTKRTTTGQTKHSTLSIAYITMSHRVLVKMSKKIMSMSCMRIISIRSGIQHKHTSFSSTGTVEQPNVQITIKQQPV